MGTNPLGKGMTNVSVNVPDQVRAQLGALADASGMSLSAYLRAIITSAVRQRLTYRMVATELPDEIRPDGIPPTATIPTPSEVRGGASSSPTGDSDPIARELQNAIREAGKPPKRAPKSGSK
jgi:hypothetical protein